MSERAEILYRTHAPPQNGHAALAPTATSTADGGEVDWSGWEKWMQGHLGHCSAAPTLYVPGNKGGVS